MSVRDFQRSRVYKAEDAIDHGKKFTSVKEMQKYCDRITKSQWWKAVYPKLKNIIVKDGRGRRCAGGYRSGETIKVTMPLFSRNELILIHEIVHGFKSTTMASHGKEYCGEYLRVVHRFMGVKIAKELLDSFDLNGVVYTEPPVVSRSNLFKNRSKQQKTG